MKRLLAYLFLVLGLLVLSNFAYARTKVSVSIAELKDAGFKLTHAFRAENFIYFILEKDNHIYECNREAGNKTIKCYHLTDGK
jgi:hypothetical protein